MARTESAAVTAQNDIEILARILGKQEGSLSRTIAKHILACKFSDADKTKMHSLAVRNQNDESSESEKRELAAYSKAGTLLSILKSRARQTVRGNTAKRFAR